MFARTAQDLGLIIRERRRKLGLDQSVLAAKVGVSRQWIIDIEKGKPRAEVALVLQTLAALGLKLLVEDGAGKAGGDNAGGLNYDIDDVIEKARGKKK